MINNGNHSEDNTIATDTRANGNHVNIIQVCPNNFWYTMLGGQIGASYDFNDDNSIGFSYTLSGSLYEGGTVQAQQTITRNNALEGMVDQFIEMNISDRPQHEANRPGNSASTSMARGYGRKTCATRHPLSIVYNWPTAP